VIAFFVVMGLAVVVLGLGYLRAGSAQVERIQAELPPMSETDLAFASLVDRFNAPSFDGQGPQR
jgi:hypothetical protein